MIERLEEIDRSIVQAINSWHSPFFDEFFWMVSAKGTWIPFYLLLLFLAYRKLSVRPLLIFVGLAIASVIIADLISLVCFKNVVERYRPSHHALLTNILHFYQLPNGDFYKGGMYGFVSSHAANFSALALFVGLSLKQFYPKLIYVLLTFVALICYSRIYLGVHYLSDLLAGAAIGATIGWIFSRIFTKQLR